MKNLDQQLSQIAHKAEAELEKAGFEMEKRDLEQFQEKTKETIQEIQETLEESKDSLDNQEELQQDLKEIQNLKQQFDQEFETGKEEKNLKQAMETKKEIQEKLQNLKEKLVPKEIKAAFTNPETNEKKEINFNIPEIIKTQQEFYQKFNLPTPSTQEINQIIQKHKQEIQEQIEQYGYDKMIIIPGNLPTTPELNETLIESMPNTGATWQSGGFQSEGGLENIKHAESKKTRVLLLHSDQNIYENENANPFLKATLSKSIIDLSGLSKEQILQKMQKTESIPINFRTSIGNQQTKIQAEGLSLNEYFIFQRQFFEENNAHLDEKGWTWLLKTFGASRVSNSLWYPNGRLLDAFAFGPGYSRGYLCARLSRSFEDD